MNPAPLVIALCTAQVESSLTFDTDRHGTPVELAETLRAAGWFEVAVDGSWTLDRAAFVTIGDVTEHHEWAAQITFY